MFAKKALGLAALVVVGMLAVAAVASADHGPSCVDQACCREHETGVERVRCEACVAVPANHWFYGTDECLPD